MAYPLLQADNQTGYIISAICSFNGKEKDYESGFHYYGARYYWSEMLIGWLSVDPMMDMYPGNAKESPHVDVNYPHGSHRVKKKLSTSGGFKND